MVWVGSAVGHEDVHEVSALLPNGLVLGVDGEHFCELYKLLLLLAGVSGLN